MARFIAAFRSALPRGERRRPFRPLPGQRGFDPRSRAGSDKRWQGRKAHMARFDPRSRAGSDLLRGQWIMRCSRFDPRSRAGSDVKPGCRNVWHA